MALFYFVFESKFQLKAPWGVCIRMGDLAEGFLHYNFGGGGYIILEGLIHGEAYFRNFMVFEENSLLSKHAAYLHRYL